MTKKKVYLSVTNSLIHDQRVNKVSNSLLKMGFDVTLIGSSSKKLNISRPYKTILLGQLFTKGFLFFAEYNLRLFFYLIFKSFDILVSNDLDTLPANRVLAWLRNKKIVFDSHEYYPEVPELQHRPLIKNVWLMLEKLFVPGLNYTYTVCDSIANIYHQKYNLKFKTIRNIPYKNKNLVTKHKPDKELIPNKNNDKIILYQGAVNYGRGIKECIEAMQYLSGYKLVILGDGNYFNEAQEKTKEFGVCEKVFFTGWIPFEQLHNYSKDAHLGLCLMENIGLNYYFSLPNRVFDYMRNGIPILASNFPEIKHIVEKYNTGILMDGLEPKLIAENINKACSDVNQRKKWELGMRRGIEELCWENEEKILKSVYQPLK